MLAAAVFVAVALAMTGIVRGSGHQIVDTGRYQEYAKAIESDLVPYRDFDVEYPPGALLVFALPELAVSGEAEYFWAFAALMAIAGGSGVLLTAAALRRLDRPLWVRRGVLGLLALSPAAFGGVLLTRYDLAPAAVVAVGTLLLLCGRPRVGSIAFGVAAALKLYPLAALPLVAAWTWRRDGQREAVVASGLVVGVVALAYLPFLLLGPDGVTQSIWRQISRPLQIESLGAGALILLDHALDFDMGVETSYGSQNLTGA
jgi:predicted membrane-bound dolichyl-phosphate-mannose-protein mannosyltransferase